MTQRENADAIASRDTTLGLLANEIISAREEGDNILCFVGLGLLVRQTMKLATPDDGLGIVQVVGKLVDDGLLVHPESSYVLSIDIMLGHLMTQSIHAPLQLEEGKIIAFNSEKVMEEMAELYTNSLLHVCRRLICS